MLILHILIALSSLAFSAYLYVDPSKQKLFMSYGLIIATLISGTYLLAIKGSHILEGCVMGLAFSIVSSLAAVSARHKLARVTIKID